MTNSERYELPIMQLFPTSFSFIPFGPDILASTLLTSALSLEAKFNSYTKLLGEL
jgi:hypothetical protein